MIKIYLTEFYANNENLVVADVIYNLQAGITKGGVVVVHFTSEDKYLNIRTNSTAYNKDFTGQVIEIMPHIYDSKCERYLEEDMVPGDYEKYLNHPNFYSLELVVDHGTMGGKYFTPTVLVLKHEYFISFFPDDISMCYDCLRDVELEDCEDDTVY